MTTEERQLTLEEFVDFVHRDENRDKNFELIHGEVAAVSPGRTSYSGVAVRISYKIIQLCEENSLPSDVTVADGAYYILGNVFAPDVAYKTTPLSDDYPDPVPPEWVVEVVSPSDEKADVERKRQIYIDAGILYWEVYFKAQRVDVYAPGKPMQSYGINDTLDGGDVLPGFRLPVNEIV